MSKDEILQIKISIEEITPKIWRRFQVEDSLTFHQLHKVIQLVMGWSDSHLYGFKAGDKEYQDEKSEDFGDVGDENILPSGKNRVSLLKEKQKFNYTYDFGDCWEHLLVVEKILPRTASVSYPVCLEGERNCPPEDCGSVPGYYNLMAVRKNKKHPEYESLIKEWLGEDYDPEYFNPQEVNTELRRMFRKKGGTSRDGRARYWVTKK